MISLYHIDRGAERISTEAEQQAWRSGKDNPPKCAIAAAWSRACWVGAEYVSNCHGMWSAIKPNRSKMQIIFAAAGAWLFHNGHGLFLLTSFVVMI